MKIVRKQLFDLKEAPYNPRVSVRDDKEFYKKLKRSIDKFGYVELIVYNVRTGNVVGGNQRLQILKDSGLQEIDCIEVDLSEEDEKVLNVALNKINGGWDLQRLSDILMDLKDLDYKNIEDTGFNITEIDQILSQYQEIPEETFDPAEAIARESKYQVKPGDVFVLGNHRLMCGDSTKKEDVERLMGGGQSKHGFY